MPFNFLEKIKEITADAETPESFLYWAGLTSLAAVAKRNVFLNKKVYVLFPNLYVFLVARSGLRKGLAMSLARQLVDNTMCTNVIYGRSSIQGILDDMSKQITFKNGYILSTASAFIISSELAASFVKDPSTQVILTDLYDSNYHAEWTNTLKKDGKSKLKELSVTFLAGTNEEHLNEFLDPASIGGGFIARTLIIKEERKARINPLIDFDEEEIKGLDIRELVDYLRLISQLKGNFKVTSAAKDLYKEWYLPFARKTEENIDFTGTAERLHDHILKVAMCLSLADDVNLIITEKHIQEGIDVCTGELNGIMSSSGKKPGKSDLSDKMGIMLEVLIKAEGHCISRKELLRQKHKDFDLNDLGRIIDTLEEAGVISVLKGDKEGPIYKLSERQIEEINFLIKKKGEV